MSLVHKFTNHFFELSSLGVIYIRSKPSHYPCVYQVQRLNQIPIANRLPNTLFIAKTSSYEYIGNRKNNFLEKKLLSFIYS